MKEEFVMWCRKHPGLWKAVKKHPDYGMRVHDVFCRVLHLQEKDLGPRSEYTAEERAAILQRARSFYEASADLRILNGLLPKPLTASHS